MMKAAVAVMALLACACSPQARQAQPDTAREIVARVGDRAISLKDVEERWEKMDAAEHAEALQKVYEGRRNALETLVGEILLTDAAKGSGLSVEAFEEAEVSKRVKPVTEDEVASFYRANINEMGGRTFEAAAPLINRFLEEQYRTAARQALVADLKKKGGTVNVMLEAPRRTVAVDVSDPFRGNKDAVVTVVEFSDFQCPYCQRANPTLKELQQRYGDRVRVVWKDFPLTQIHPDAFRAAQAAHCAGDQGKFWEYHDQLFGNQSALKADDLKKYAAATALEPKQFEACLSTAKHQKRVQDSIDAGTKLGVNSTPTLYINGRVLAGAYPIETLVAVVDEELERLKR